MKSLFRMLAISSLLGTLASAAFASDESMPDQEAAPPKATKSKEEIDTRKRERSDAATMAALKSLLIDVWESDPENVSRLGSSALRRAARDRADVAAVQFAYGLALSRHENWDASVNAFRASGKAGNDLFPIANATIFALFNADKTDAAIAALESAVRSDASSIGLIESLAAAATFYRDGSGPKRARQRRLVDLETVIFRELTEEQKRRYREQKEKTERYLADLPALREKLLETVREIEQKMIEAEDAYKVAERDRSTQLQARLFAQRDLTNVQAEAANDAARFDRAIAEAELAKDAARASRLRAQKSSVQARHRQTATRISTEIDRIARIILEIERKMQTLTTTHRELEKNAKAEQQKVELKLARPPLPFDLEQEKQRLLEQHGLAPTPSTVTKPSGAPSRQNHDKSKLD